MKFITTYQKISKSFFQTKKFQNELNAIINLAEKSLGERPNYQIFSGHYPERATPIVCCIYLVDPVYKTQELAGFTSALLFHSKSMPDVLHLGLTCVDKEFRGLGLTNKLFSKLLIRYLLSRSIKFPLNLNQKLWISNCAGVLSSLGNVGRYFADVYPSPYSRGPSQTHKNLADNIAKSFRQHFWVPDHIRFDHKNFVFIGSIAGNCFAKSSKDKQYYHRSMKHNRYYHSIMDIDRGDEVLQIGWFSIASFIKQFIIKYVGFRKIQRSIISKYYLK